MGGTLPPAADEDVATSATYLGNVPPASRGSVAELPLVCPSCGVHYPAEFKVCPRDATELVDARSSGPPDDLVGQTLAGTYAVTRVLGEGGMGRVYEARHLRIGGKRFAIKALHPEYTRNVEVLSRFQREAEAAAAVKSAHVMQVFDVLRTDDGRPFMVAEFLSGRELADHIIDQGRMMVADAVRIARQICSGLEAAHAMGVVHRDMKPENVFLLGDPSMPTAKILDFGISKHGDKPGTQLTKTGVIMGTPSFMAPEQARGEKVNHLVDIYSVGAILYTMLTGRRPFDKGDPTATLTALLLEDPPRPRSLEPSIPPALEAVIQRAMAKNASDRYQDMASLSRDLEPFERSAEIVAPSGNQRPNEASRRSSVGLGVLRKDLVSAGLLSVAMGAGALLTFFAGLFRVAHGGTVKTSLSGGEAAALFSIGALLSAAALVLGFVHVRGMKAEEESRTESLLRDLELPAFVGLGVFGFGSLVIRFVEVLAVRKAVGSAWPAWEVLLGASAMVAAGVAFLVRRLEDR